MPDFGALNQSKTATKRHDNFHEGDCCQVETNIAAAAAAAAADERGVGFLCPSHSLAVAWRCRMVRWSGLT